MPIDISTIRTSLETAVTRGSFVYSVTKVQKDLDGNVTQLRGTVTDYFPNDQVSNFAASPGKLYLDEYNRLERLKAEIPENYVDVTTIPTLNVTWYANGTVNLPVRDNMLDLIIEENLIES